jgi:ABC-type cobalamin/Fe3+-siderophores transport system ATPase subunit
MVDTSRRWWTPREDGGHLEKLTAIMGPSGSGKSTLQHFLAALDNATSGQVSIGEAQLNSLSDKELPGPGATASGSSSSPSTWFRR